MKCVEMDSREGYQNENADPQCSGRVEEDSNSRISQIAIENGQNRFCGLCAPKSCSCCHELCSPDDAAGIAAKRIYLEFLVKSFRSNYRAYDMGDLDHILVSPSLVTNMKSLGMNPPRRLIFDTVEALMNPKSLPKSPSILLPARTTRQARSVSQSEQKHLSRLIATERALSRKKSLPRSRVSQLNARDKISLPSSSGTTTCSCQGALNNVSFRVGLLHRIWKNGLPYFEYSVDDPSEVYLANPLKVLSSTDKALDFMYLFHLGTVRKNDFLKNSRNSAQFVGKLSVSSFLTLNADRCDDIETEFVLYGSYDCYYKELQDSSATIKSKGLVKMATKMLKPGNSPKPKYGHKTARSFSQFDDIYEAIEDNLKSNEASSPDYTLDDFPANLELAAVVVQEKKQKCTKYAVGGWGLKFLDKAEKKCSKFSDVNRIRQSSCSQSECKSSRHVSVLIPTGFHGGPISKAGGPASLTARWRTGGHCDCGGWDTGCPITTLRGNCCTHLTSESRNITDVVNQGSKYNEPMLRLVALSEDLFLVYFHSTISSLQSISVAVSLLHSEVTSDLRTNL